MDPLDSTSRLLDPEYVSYEHYKTTRDTQKILQDYKSLQDIIAILGTSFPCFLATTRFVFRKAEHRWLLL